MIDPMTEGEHPIHTVQVHKAEALSMQTRAPLNGGQQSDAGGHHESKPDANPLREIVLRPAEWEGVPVPPRRWLRETAYPCARSPG
jgi:hypothetical protein